MANAVKTIPQLTIEQKFIIRDKQLQFIEASNAIQNLNLQIKEANDKLKAAQESFQSAFNEIVEKLGVDLQAYNLDLGTLTFVSAAQQQAASE